MRSRAQAGESIQERRGSPLREDCWEEGGRAEDGAKFGQCGGEKSLSSMSLSFTVK